MRRPAGSRAGEAPRRVDFTLALRVYWEDTDAAGIVFYANYLKFFERARTEWLRSKGFEQERLRSALGVAFVVTDTSVRYRAPARLDDVLDISVAVDHCGQASLTLVQEARRAGGLVADGAIRIGCVELGTFTPCRIPNDILQAIR